MTDEPDAPAYLPEFEATPSAEHVRLILRAQNIKLAVGAVVLVALGGIAAFYAVAGAAASRDSNDATSASLANNARNACITERRNAELDAIGRAIVEGLQAQKSLLIDRESAAGNAHLEAFDVAVTDRQAAADALAPEVLNAEAPVGCGPPVLSRADLPDSDPTSSTSIEP